MENVMKIHKMNEKNQVKNLSNVELSHLSKEEMRSATGGVYETGYKIRIRGIQYTIGLKRTRTL